MVGPVTEQWKTFPGDERYSVSNWGRIRNNKKGVIVKGSLGNHGYWQFRLGRYGKVKLTHRMVAETFIGPPPDSTRIFINHKDGDRVNNRADNLEWVTCKENSTHALHTGLYKLGTERKSAKLTDADIPKIRILLEHLVNDTVIADAFGVTQATIRLVKTGRNWSHVD